MSGHVRPETLIPLIVIASLVPMILHNLIQPTITLDGVIAAVGLVVTLLVPVAIWALRCYHTRVTVKHKLSPLAEAPSDAPIMLTPAKDHEVWLWVVLRKAGPVYEFDVACLDQNTWLMGPGDRAPLDTIRIDHVEDVTHEHAQWVTNRLGRRWLKYDPPVVKGVRPFALKVHVLAFREWSGYLSVRDNDTGRKGRVRVIVKGRPDSGLA